MPERTGMDVIRDWLLMHVELYRMHNVSGQWDKPCQLVLDEGVEYTPQPLPAEYERGEVKQCFQNALLTAVFHPELTYVEGYALGSIMPVHHAWCVDEAGRVVELTWEEPGTAYLGVAFDTEDASAMVHEKGTYGVLDSPLCYNTGGG